MVSRADVLPRCHSCRYRKEGLEILTYRRADGVPGCSYPDCADCRRNNAARLKRLGFTILTGDPERDEENHE